MRGRIFKKYKSSWTIVISLGRDEAGRYRQKWLNVRGNHKTAEKKLTELLFQLDGGASLERSKITFGDFLLHWVRGRKTNVSPRTYDRYEGIVLNHIIPDIGAVPIEALARHHLQRHYDKMLGLGLKPRTVRFHHAVIHRALKTAARNGLVPFNIADSADPPGYRAEEMTTWSVEELNKFLSSVQSHTLYALFYLALFTGMRRSELLGLQWRDINFQNAQISIRRALHHLRDGSYIFTQPKTEKSRRSIALSPSTIAVLESHRKAQDGQEKADGDRLVFLKGNDHLNPNTVTWDWKKACIAAGVRPIRLHDGRHTHASLMLAQGIHPKIVQERLGHSSIQITLDTYSHVVPGLQEAAAVKFDTLIKP